MVPKLWPATIARLAGAAVSTIGMPTERVEGDHVAVASGCVLQQVGRCRFPLSDQFAYRPELAEVQQLPEANKAAFGQVVQAADPVFVQTDAS